MKLIVLCTALLGLACSIDPVITNPENASSDRYADCKRAARDYCRDTLQPADDEMRSCVSRATYECVANRSK
jgi:hypothetical protein